MVVERGRADVTEGLAEEEDEEEEEAEGCAVNDELDPVFDELLVLLDPSSCSSLARNAVASGVG